MSRILHVVNSFDPAGSVVRDAEQLKKYSWHEHELWVREAHPNQAVYQYPLAENIGDFDRLQNLLDWCDAIVYHFKGWRGTNLSGSFVGLDDAHKPAAFRSLNIYYSTDMKKSWTAPVYNGEDSGFDRYSIFAGAHVGARDFLPSNRPFFWTQCMTSVDGLYSPDWQDRKACISFIKHWEELSKIDFGAESQDLHNTSLQQVLSLRRQRATIVVGNVSDGHYGLAGTEALLMGLPVVTFNCPETKRDLLKLTDGVESPFVEVGSSISEVVDAIRRLLAESSTTQYSRRLYARKWSEKFFNPKYLVEKQWDPFCNALVNS